MLTSTESTSGEAEGGYVGRIPIRNIWLLMLYASSLRSLPDLNPSGVEDNPDEIPDLIAEYLAGIVEIRLRRNLNYSFVTRSAEVQRVRGRIDLIRTERRSLLLQGRIHCHFNELTLDSPRNRYVRVALERATHLARNPKIASRCRSLAVSLGQMGVSVQMPSAAELLSDPAGRNDLADQQMLEAARLMFEFSIPAESAGSRRSDKPRREETWLRALFEKAIFGFYEVMLVPNGWRVIPGRKLFWNKTTETERIGELLPDMKTDIILESSDPAHRIVIDTKFTEIVKSNQFGGERFKSGYIYQLYTYLFSQVGNRDPLADTASGMLLHPSIESNYCETVRIQGHNLRFATVDLTASANKIKEQLLDAVEGL